MRSYFLSLIITLCLSAHLLGQQPQMLQVKHHHKAKKKNDLPVLEGPNREKASLHHVDEMSILPTDPKELYIDVVKKILANTIYEDDDSHGRYTVASRMYGLDWPLKAHTMIGMKRLNNIHECMKCILENDVPGDCIETGVWRGGATILMRAILQAYGDDQRKVWVVDSFAGLPPSRPSALPCG